MTSNETGRRAELRQLAPWALLGQALVLAAAAVWVASGAVAAGTVTAVLLATALIAGVTAVVLPRPSADAAVPDAVVHRLAGALDREAMRTNAIKQIDNVRLVQAGPAALSVIVELTFKDGVAARHVGPLLTKLRLAAKAEVPQVVDVLLASPTDQPSVQGPT